MGHVNNIRLLKKGKDAWNDYKKEHPNFSADFTFDDLSNTDFTGFNLMGADFTGANLCGCIFKSTILNWAKFFKSNLRNAKIYQAGLSEINFSESDMSEVCFGPGVYLQNSKFIKTNLTKAVLVDCDLSHANLTEANLSEATLKGCNFFMANLNTATLYKATLTKVGFIDADLSNVDLSEAYLPFANLSGANFSNANLSKAFLSGVNLSRANLTNANLSSTLLQQAVLVEAKMEGCVLKNSFIYGLSAWALEGKPKDQSGLIITPKNRGGQITVDDLQMAQFIFLILNNNKIRNVIDTVTSKAVLILGRFTPDRKEALNIIRQELNKFNYVPVLFDFENTENQTLLETVMTLAGMARFIIADVTCATMVREELRSIVEKYPSKPIQPILLQSEKEYVTLPEIILGFNSILPVYYYETNNTITTQLKKNIIDPIENWLQIRKTKIVGNNKTAREEELEKQIETLKEKLKEKEEF